MTGNQMDGGAAAALSWASSDTAEAWLKMEPLHVRTFGSATERLLDAAGLTAGQHVLDVAAGTGEQTAAAARRVGPTGRVTAVDISASMLEGARAALAQRGLDNVELRVMAAQRLEFASDSFDAAISRFGLMLVPDPGQALGEIHRVLKAGARAAVLVWSRPEANPFQALPFAILERFGILPPPTSGSQPGPFALGTAEVLEHTFQEAHFREVVVEPIPLVWRFDAIEQALDYYRLAAASLGREALAKVDAAAREQVFGEFERALSAFERSGGLEVPGEVLLGCGLR